jgi:hypothetical protein
MESILLVLFIFIGAGLWFLPFALIIGSDKTSGKEKVVWLLALFFISWFAWIAYIVFAPLGSNRVSTVK